MNILLKGLTQPQIEAVTHPAGPIMVVAGPGSGKTRVITHRIAWVTMELEVHPRQILGVTFTRKAAAEMRQRCQKLVGDRGSDLRLSTFHSFGAKILRDWPEQAELQAGFTIYDEDDRRRAISKVLDVLKYDRKSFPPREVQAAISRAKNRGLTVGQYTQLARGRTEEVYAETYIKYEELLKQSNAVDFDDLLLKPARLLDGNEQVADCYKNEFQHILVDEFQDSNKLQMRICQRITNPSGNIFVVGDPDQSIYGWRYAEISNMLEFERYFPTVHTVRLDQSFRCTPNILSVANRLINHNPRRFERQLNTTNEDGPPPHFLDAEDEEGEARMVGSEIGRLVQKGCKLEEIVVMYRTNAQSRAFETTFRQLGIDYILFGGVGFFERREIKDLLCYLRLILNRDDEAAFERIINTPRRGIGAHTMAQLRYLASERSIGIVEAIKLCVSDKKSIQMADAKRLELGKFVALLAELTESSRHMPPAKLLQKVVLSTNYKRHLEADELFEERMDNVEELIGVAHKYSQPDNHRQALEKMLADVALEVEVSAFQDTAHHKDEQKVTLTTIHKAKGLEYDTVFVTGLEERILPHARSMESRREIEEERRLLYVALTRARKVLYITNANWRRGRDSIVSRFVDELRPVYPLVTRTMETGVEPATKTGTKFTIGTKVVHQKFGEGIVLSVSGSAKNKRLTVVFMNSGVKKLAPRDELLRTAHKPKRHSPKFRNTF